MTIRIPYLLLFGMFFFMGTTWALGQQDRPNIVLIMADDLGYGELSCYGSEKVNTPNLDRLAERGTKFSDFHANGPVCSPTRVALMTGRYQQRSGVEGVITAANHRDVGLSLNEKTMAEALKELGYRCAIFGKWHLGYDAAYNPKYQGFDDFTGFVGGNVDYISHVDQAGYLDWWQGTEINDEPGYTTDLITEYGERFIKEQHPGKTGKPFFLYLPHEAPHYPIQGRNDAPVRHVGSGEYFRKVPKDSIPIIYTEMIETMDEGIGRIMKTLEEEGLAENTIIVFCSDNGAAGNRGDNGKLRAAKASLYEGGHRVPAIMSYPGHIPEKAESQATVLSMDLLPTFIDFAGGDSSKGNYDGISIKSHLLENETLPERQLFWSFKKQASVRDGNWKLMVNRTEKGEKTELYDLAADLSEQNDLSGRHPKKVKKMWKKLNKWKKDVLKGVAVIAE